MTTDESLRRSQISKAHLADPITGIRTFFLRLTHGEQKVLSLFQLDVLFCCFFFCCFFLKQKSLLVKLSMKALTFVYFFITTFLLNEIFSCFSIFLFIDNRKIRPYAPPVQGQISPQTLM